MKNSNHLQFVVHSSSVNTSSSSNNNTNGSSIPNHSNNSSASNGTSTGGSSRTIFKGEFKTYKIGKPKRMSKQSTVLVLNNTSSSVGDQYESKKDQQPKPIPVCQKKDSIMSQLTFHESYSKDLCPFGTVKTKNATKHHPYVQQFVLNNHNTTCNNQSSNMPTNFPSQPLSNNKVVKSDINIRPISRNSPPQKDGNFQIFHFKVGQQGAHPLVGDLMMNQHLNSSNPILVNQQNKRNANGLSSNQIASWLPPSTCSVNFINSTNGMDMSSSSRSSSQQSPESLSSLINVQPIKMETVVPPSEPFIILPPFKESGGEDGVHRLESQHFKIPSIKYIESMIYSKNTSSLDHNGNQIYS